MKRTPLKANPDKVKAWISKRSEPLKQGAGLARGKGLARSSTLKPKSPNARPKRIGYDYEEFWMGVCTRRSGDKRLVLPCLVCGTRDSIDAHHVIPKQRLTAMAARLGIDAEGLGQLLMDKRNGVPLCRYHHDAHEAAQSRVERSALPPQALAFAHRLDKTLGTEENAMYLETAYR